MKIIDERKKKEYEVKYNLSLVTLDNYKERVTNVNERNKQLESQIKSFQNTIKQDKYEIADLKLENKKMEKHINNIEKDIRKDIIKEYREKIIELKGHITKANILTLLK